MSPDTQPCCTPGASLPPYFVRAPKEIEEEFFTITNALKHDPTLNGIWHLGKDGVLRSLTADREVVDAAALRPELIKAFIDRFPYNAQNEVNYRGVDGTKVPREQWFHVEDKSSLPPPYTPSEERRNISPEQLEKERQVLEEKRKNRKSELYFVSNHDLGLEEMASNLEDKEKA